MGNGCSMPIKHSNDFDELDVECMQDIWHKGRGNKSLTSPGGDNICK